MRLSGLFFVPIQPQPKEDPMSVVIIIAVIIIVMGLLRGCAC